MYSFESEYGEDEIRLLNQVLKPGANTLEAMNIVLSQVREREENILVGDEKVAHEKEKGFRSEPTRKSGAYCPIRCTLW